MDQEWKTPNVDCEQPPPYSTEQNKEQPPYPVQQNQPTAPYPVQQQMPMQSKPSNDVEAFLVATSNSNPNGIQRQHVATSREPSPYRYLYPISAISGYLCCFFIGLLAVYFAKRSNLNWARGDKEAAKSDAIKSVIFTVASIVVGTILVAIIIVIFVFRAIILAN